MSNKSNNQGRAYEYIFLHSLHDAISQVRKSSIIQDSSYVAARNAWETLSDKEKEIYFRNLKSKEDDVYVPILKAFMKEVKKQVEQESIISRRLVEYLLNKYDFYKVVSNDSKHHTTTQTFNMSGTHNRPSRKERPTIKVPTVKLPSTLLFIGLKPKSKTTVLMCFDNGWQFSFRIHNAKDIVEPSLKFDIQIEGMPSNLNI